MAILGLAPVAEAAQYTIKPGDNLWNIARQYNTSVAKLKEMNNLTSNKLDVGKKLQVPDIVQENSNVPAAKPTVSRSFRDVEPSADSADTVSQTETVTSITASRGAVVRRNIISSSFALIGKPYRYGGMSPKGFDCSGFVGYIFKSQGISLPHSSASQFSKGTSIDKSELIPGDLVFFRTDGSKKINHVGIYIGDNRFIHAATGKGITTNTLDSKYYSKSYAGARRIIEP